MKTIQDLVNIFPLYKEKLPPDTNCCFKYAHDKFTWRLYSNQIKGDSYFKIVEENGWYILDEYIWLGLLEIDKSRFVLGDIRYFQEHIAPVLLSPTFIENLDQVIDSMTLDQFIDLFGSKGEIDKLEAQFDTKKLEAIKTLFTSFVKMKVNFK
jgi:hypothetical protein